MATISENLQIIKDSTDAIKQAIIDKGGTIEGDITTWANAINGISGEGSSSESEYIFTGTISYNMTTVSITGSLNKVPNIGTSNSLVALGKNMGGICYGDYIITTQGPYTLTVDFYEPLSGTEIPALCILTGTVNGFTVIPVKFEKENSTDPA